MLDKHNKVYILYRRTCGHISGNISVEITLGFTECHPNSMSVRCNKYRHSKKIPTALLSFVVRLNDLKGFSQPK